MSNGENLYDDIDDVGKDVAEEAKQEGSRRFMDYAKKQQAMRRNAASSKKGGIAAAGADAKGGAAAGAGKASTGLVSADEAAAGTVSAASETGKAAEAGKAVTTAASSKGGAALLAAGKVVIIGALALGLLLVVALLLEHTLQLADDVPQVIIDTPHETGFQIDESVSPDPLSANEYEAYANSIRAIEEGIKIAQERAIEKFLREIERKGLDKEETLRNSDLSGLLEVSYEPLVINAVYAVMMRQEGCTIDDIREILAENLEFKYTLSGNKKKEKTELFEYRGVIHYKGFYAYEWRYGSSYYDEATGQWVDEKWLEKVFIDNKQTVKYAVATFEPLTRDDFFNAFGYDDDTMGDTYYAEPYVMKLTGWAWLDKFLDNAMRLGTYSDTPHRESYFDAIYSMTQTTEKYLFNTVGGQDLDGYFSPGYMHAYLKPEDVGALRGYVSEMASTVNNLEIVEVTAKEIFYDKNKKQYMRALSDIPGQLTEERIQQLQEKAAECVAIVNSWNGGYVTNRDRMTLEDNLDSIRESALHNKMKDAQKNSILSNTREAISILWQTIVIGMEDYMEDLDAADAEREGKTIRKNVSDHGGSNCNPSGSL